MVSSPCCKKVPDVEVLARTDDPRDFSTQVEALDPGAIVISLRTRAAAAMSVIHTPLVSYAMPTRSSAS